jgi:hypothetical protein
MGTQENKAVVSRFMNEVTTGRNTDPDLIDELLAPNYVNLAMGDADLAGFKAMAPTMISMMKEARIDDLELVAEGGRSGRPVQPQRHPPRREHDNTPGACVLPPRRRQDRGE